MTDEESVELLASIDKLAERDDPAESSVSNRTDVSSRKNIVLSEILASNSKARLEVKIVSTKGGKDELEIWMHEISSKLNSGEFISVGKLEFHQSLGNANSLDPWPSVIELLTPFNLYGRRFKQVERKFKSILEMRRRSALAVY
jgi:hypothetical protein